MRFPPDSPDILYDRVVGGLRGVSVGVGGLVGSGVCLLGEAGVCLGLVVTTRCGSAAEGFLAVWRWWRVRLVF